MDENYSGQVVDGRYRLDEMLGEGGMGAVYSGVQLAVDRRVAVKLLHPFLQRNQNFKARFELEAKALARLSHPNCITLFDFGYCDEIEIFYMVLEFVEGAVLSDWMVDTIAYADMLEISYQVLLALEHAHSQGILHRDLKPENIMVQRDGDSIRLKVLDFGLARLLLSEDDEQEPPDTTTQRRERLTKAGEIYGTPAYMSPEQCRGSRDLSQSADLYSLGVMMFEMVENRLPFFDESPTVIMVKQLNEEPPEVESAVDPDIKMLIEWMLRKEPESRPSSARQVLEVLQRHVRGSDSSTEFSRIDSGSFAMPASRAASRAEEKDEHGGRRILYIAATVLVVIVLGVVAVLASSDEEAEAETDVPEVVIDDEPERVVEADTVAGKSVDQIEVDGAESGESSETFEMTFGEFEVDDAGFESDAGLLDEDVGIDAEPPEVKPSKKKRKKKRKSRRSKKEPERPRKLKLTY